MTPETLHRRIMLHELRSILLDETREGTKIHERFDEAWIKREPHNPDTYLILADWFDESGDELGELCRIQCELIGLLPVEGFISDDHRYPRLHPMHRDMTALRVFEDAQPKRLAERRWEIVEGLYPRIEQSDLLEQYANSNSIDPVTVTPRKLGRTTRMLTDVLRYCCLNEGKVVRITHKKPATAYVQLSDLAVELMGKSPFVLDCVGNPLQPQGLDANLIWCTEPGSHVYGVDITFTDHAVQTGVAAVQSPIEYARQMERQRAADIVARRQMDNSNGKTQGRKNETRRIGRT